MPYQILPYDIQDTGGPPQEDTNPTVLKKVTTCEHLELQEAGFMTWPVVPASIHTRKEAGTRERGRRTRQQRGKARCRAALLSHARAPASAAAPGAAAGGSAFRAAACADHTRCTRRCAAGRMSPCVTPGRRAPRAPRTDGSVCGRRGTHARAPPTTRVCQTDRAGEAKRVCTGERGGGRRVGLRRSPKEAGARCGGAGALAGKGGEGVEHAAPGTNTQHCTMHNEPGFPKFQGRQAHISAQT
eukprot:364798-Chlamydomonas_euryale.AAC.16